MNRRGTIYLIVLSTMVLCGVVASAGLILAGIAGERVRASADAGRARKLAQSGLEMAGDGMLQSMAWRSGLGVKGLIATSSLDAGTITLKATDPVDDLIANSPDDTVVVTSEAQVGGARKMYQATFVPNTAPAPMYAYAMFAGGSITTGTATLWSYAPLAAIGGFGLNSSTFNANVVSGSTATGMTYAGTVATGQTLAALPAAADIVAEYAALGTEVTASGGATIVVEKLVLSPASNPLGGGTNTKGIYVINCAGKNVTIRKCRINGTLVLRNVGAGSLVQNSVCFDPATSGYPSLIVEGAITLSLSGSDLSESTENINFNPAGSPYAGDTDSSKNDSYPSEFGGLVYVSGALTVNGTLATYAPVVCAGNISLAMCTVKLRWANQTWAPPAFRASPDFYVTRSAWTRTVD